MPEEPSDDVRVVDQMTVRGVVTTRIWSASALERVRPNWSNLPRETRHRLLSKPERYPASPKYVGKTENLVLNAYLEAFAAGENPTPSHLALGDGTTEPQASNTSLNNEVYRSIVGQDEADGRDRLTSTFLSQDEANGLALREVGFTDGPTTEDWQQLTHVVLSTSDQIDQKTSDEIVTYQYELHWRRVS